MKYADFSMHRSRLKRAACLLIEGQSVRKVAKVFEPKGNESSLPESTVGRLPKVFEREGKKSSLPKSTVGRLRKYLAERSTTGYPESLMRKHARKYAGDFAYKTARGWDHYGWEEMERRPVGRPPKPPAKPVKGVWQKGWASAGLGMREVAAAANGSPLGRKPYVVKLADPSRLEAHSPGGRRAYLYDAEKPLRPMTLAKALAELGELTGPGLRVYYYDHWLFQSPRMRARLGEATFVALAPPTATTELVSRKVTLTAPAPRRPQRKPRTPKMPSIDMPVPLAALATDWT